METVFSRADIELVDGAYLNKGRWGNADLYRFQYRGGEWVVKDFRHCPPLVRDLWGAVMVRRELLALRRLAGIPGVPQKAFRLDRYALCYEYMQGTVLADVPNDRTPPSFFEALEDRVRQMHARGLCHLDIRYRRNILVLIDGSPGLLDFQSHLGIGRLPAFLRRWLEEADLSGVYKHWWGRCPGTISEDRLRLLRAADRRRGMWVLKGYGLRLKPKRQQDYGLTTNEKTK